MENARTQTVACDEDGELLIITYDKVRKLHFHNPTSGFYLLLLSSERLLKNAARLENTLALAQQKSAQGTMSPAGASADADSN